MMRRRGIGPAWPAWVDWIVVCLCAHRIAWRIGLWPTALWAACGKLDMPCPISGPGDNIVVDGQKYMPTPSCLRPPKPAFSSVACPIHRFLQRGYARKRPPSPIASTPILRTIAAKQPLSDDRSPGVFLQIPKTRTSVYLFCVPQSSFSYILALLCGLPPRFLQEQNQQHEIVVILGNTQRKRSVGVASGRQDAGQWRAPTRTVAKQKD